MPDIQKDQNKKPVLKFGQKTADFFKGKNFDLKKSSPIKQVQFHGTQHRG